MTLPMKYRTFIALLSSHRQAVNVQGGLCGRFSDAEVAGLPGSGAVAIGRLVVVLIPHEDGGTDLGVFSKRARPLAAA